MLADSDMILADSKDPFWDYAAFLLYCAVIERKKAGIFRCAAI